jgi:hypothetical protein
MKKKLLYSVCAALLVVAGCTKFEEEASIPFAKGPTVSISGTDVAGAVSDTSVKFSVAPDAAAGYYSFLVVEAAKALASPDSSRVLKLSYDGVAEGTVNYADSVSARIYVEKLTPNTAYKIYAVAANTGGMAGAVSVADFATKDNGKAPAPSATGAVTLADSTVTVTFTEPIKRATDAEKKLYVTFHAVNAQGAEAYNPTVTVPADSVSAAGAALTVKLPPHPAFGHVPPGAWVTVTYDEGFVVDLGGVPAAAVTYTGVYNGTKEVFDGLSARVAATTWGFEPAPEDTLIALTDWANDYLTIVPDSTLPAPVAGVAKTYQLVYQETGKAISIDMKSAAYSDARDTIFLPTGLASEEAKRGAYINAVIPKGAFEDIFGNASTAFTVEDLYIYSYGYTKADVLGTYTVNLFNWSDVQSSITNIIISDYGDTPNDTVVVRNLFADGTIIKAVFDGVLGTLAIPDVQFLKDNITLTLSGEQYTGDIYFANAYSVLSGNPVTFSVPEAGVIISDYYSSSAWGYLFIVGEDALAWASRYAYSVWEWQP